MKEEEEEEPRVQWMAREGRWRRRRPRQWHRRRQGGVAASGVDLAIDDLEGGEAERKKRPFRGPRAALNDRTPNKRPLLPSSKGFFSAANGTNLTFFMSLFRRSLVFFSALVPANNPRRIDGKSNRSSRLKSS